MCGNSLITARTHTHTHTHTHRDACVKRSYLESGYLVSVARLLVYMWPPTSMWTGALDLVSCAGRGMPCVARGDTGDRVRDRRDMLLPSWKQVYMKAIGSQ